MDGLRIVRGEPDDEELAALVVVLSAVLARREPEVRAAVAPPGSTAGATWMRAGHYASAPGAWIGHRDGGP